MSIKQAVASVMRANPLGRTWLESRRIERVQRDWSTLHREKVGATTFSVSTTVGMGDVMVAKQLCQEFVRHCQTYGDPKLGHIVITGGAWPLEFKLQRGDHNVYWWWSMNGQDDWLDRYLERTSVRPDVVACLSSWCSRYAEAAGIPALYLPLAVGEHFKPLGLSRKGIGYGGSKGHKDVEQVAAVIGPFVDDPDFEWASGFTTPQQINEFYNRRSIVLGMTERYQEKAGMVNNRVFEVLASGTPFIIHRHRALEELLGQPFPYQSDAPARSRALADEILADYPKHLAVFDGYRQTVEAKHRYTHRLKTLIDFLGER